MVDASQSPFISQIAGSPYQQTMLSFPDDVGSGGGYHGHAIMININVPTYSTAGSITGPDGNGILNYSSANRGSTLDALKSYYNGQFSDSSGSLATQTSDGITAVNQNTQRITAAIVLYMPSTYVIQSHNNYEEVNLTEWITSAISGFVGGISDGAGNKYLEAGQGIAKRAAQLNNTPINPRVEVLYTNTNLRDFSFQFLMAPSNPQESLTIKNIIQLLRFHAAPELSNNYFGKGGLGGFATSILSPFFITPPASFDFTFFKDGKENTEIPRINTSALISYDIDYAPSGQWATFSDGRPVSIRMVLNFKELAIVTKLSVAQGF